MVIKQSNRLQGTTRDAGIEVLGLYSENLGRLAGFIGEVADKEKVIIDILKGNKQLDDFIGEEIVGSLVSEFTE